MRIKIATTRGFTLVETLIAILVLMMALAGPLTMAQKGLQLTLIAKDQDTAFYLAQDAVEYVRWVRDTNKLNSRSWLTGLDGCLGASGCYVDSLKNIVTACSGTCPVIKYDPANNFFSYTTGNNSIFTRTVAIATPVGTNDCTAGYGCEASVTVTVTWSDQGTLVRTVRVRENMFDWQ